MFTGQIKGKAPFAGGGTARLSRTQRASPYEDYTAAVKAKVNLLDLIRADVPLKRVASTDGGEWAGPCPWCGGKDRFRVWPEKGRYWCRQCNESGDCITYLQRREGLDFKSALQRLGAPIAQEAQPKTKSAAPDARHWLERAEAFVAECAETLWTDEATKARQWLNRRGLEDQTLKYWRIGFNRRDLVEPAEDWGLEMGKVHIPRGITIPCEAERLWYVKIRRPAGEPKYLMVRGSRQWLFGARTLVGAFDAFLFEGEFDAMLAWQAWQGGLGFMSLPAGQTFKPEWAPYFLDVERVLVAYDNDESGEAAAQELCRRSPRWVRRRIPAGNDLTDFHCQGGNVFEWLYESLRADDG